MLPAQELLSQYEEYLFGQGLSPVSIERKLSSVRAYLTFIQPKKKDLSNRPAVTDYEERLAALGIKVKGASSLWSQLLLVRLAKNALRAAKSLPVTLSYTLKYRRPAWFIRYQKHPGSHYLNLGLVILVCVVLGIGGYEQFNQFIAKKKGQVLGLPTNAPTYLSFQGLLTDSSGNPITIETHFRFSIYNSLTASGSAKLYEEAKWVKPDQDGIFNTLIGDTTVLDKTIFRDNTDLFLGVTVNENEEMTPRQRIATVAYAFNSQYLQGYGVGTTGANTNEIPVVDGSGNLIIAAASPSLKTTSGTFKIESPTLALMAGVGSGNVGIGTSSPTQKFQINGTGASAFVVTSSGLVGIGTASPTQKLDVNGSLNVGGTGIFNSLAVNGAFFDSANSPGTNGLVLTSTGTGVSWTNVSGSGGDAETLDGLDSTQFLRSDTNDNFTSGTLTFNAGTILDVNGNLDVGGTGIFATLQLSGAFYDKNSQIGTIGQVLSSTGDGVDWIDMSATGIGGSGTINYLPRFTASTTLGNSLIYDNGTNIGIGTTNPTQKFDVNGNINVGGTGIFNTLKLIGALFDAADSPGGSGQVLTSTGIGVSWTAVSSLPVGDADTLDTLDSLDFLRSTASDTFEAGNTLTIAGDLIINDSNIGLGGTSANLTTTGNFSINGSQFFLNQASGNVGIGTTATSSYKLNVDGQINSTGLCIGGDCKTDWASAGTNYWTKIGTTLSPLTVTDNVATHGNVGVGTTSITAGYALDVNGNIKVGGTAYFNSRVGIGTTTPEADLEVSGPTGLYLRKSGANPQLQIYASNTAYHSDLRTTITGLNFTTNIGGFIFNGGNVGIGSSNPLSKLDVAGGVAIGSYAQTYSAPLNGAIVSGNVGIGVTTPLSALHVAGNALINNTSAQALLEIRGATNAQDANLFLAEDGSAGGGLVYSANANRLYLYTTTSGAVAGSYLERMTIDRTTGNVGIGTTNPRSLLEISGAGNVTSTITSSNQQTPSLILQRGTGTDAYIDWRISNNKDTGNLDFGNKSTGAESLKVSIDMNGNVGIGTTDPTQKLDVVGNLNVSGTGIFTNTKVGGLQDVNNNLGSSGWLLTSTGTGVSWMAANSTGIGTTYNAGSGLTLASNVFKLGGTLTENTRLNIGATEALYISYPSGNVGIGTTGPEAKLHIAGGNILIGNNQYYQGERADGVNLNILGIDGSNNIQFGSGSAQDIYFDTYSFDNAMVIKGTSGNVGIGTVGNKNKLDISGSLAVGSYAGVYSAPSNGVIISGNVGIGVTSPSKTLDISGGDYAGLGISNGTDSFISQFHSIQGTFNIATSTSKDIKIFTNNATTAPNLYLKVGGNVGIGTTNPTQKLTIVRSGTIQDTPVVGSDVMVYGAGSAYIGARDVTNDIEYAIGTSNLGGAFVGSMTNHDFWLRTNNTTRVTVDTSGNVGVGTTDPTQKLDVNGNIKVGGTGIFNTFDLNGALFDTGNLPGGTGMVLTSTGVGVSWGTLTSLLSGQYESPLTFTSGLTRTGNTIELGGATALSKTTAINQAGYNFGFQGGNVGIGTTVPTSGYILDVNGNIKVGGTAYFANRVGIGTTNPEAKLDISGNTANAIQAIFTRGVNDNFFQLISANGNAGNSPDTLEAYFGLRYAGTNDATAGINFYRGSSSTDSYLVFKTNAAERMIITNTGNVGIGTTGNKNKLDISGSLAVGSYAGVYSAPTNGAIISGNVGIGTTSTTVQLEVYKPTSTATLNVTQGNGATVRLQAADTYGYLGTWDTNPLYLGFNSNFVMAFDTGGRVGIGTTNPTQKLDVNGNLNVGGTGFFGSTKVGILLDKDSQPGTNKQVLASTGSGVDWLDITSIGIGGSGTVNYLPKFAASTTLGNSQIFDNGNVGIGTTAPAETLDIIGDLNLSGVLQVGSAPTGLAYHQFGTGSKDEATIDSAQDVFISGDLEINGTLYAQNISGAVSGSGTPNMIARFTGTGDTVGNSNIYDNGNVGIGTTSPTQKLDINGNLNVGGTGILSSLRLTGAFYDVNNQIGSSGQVLASTGSTVDWVDPATLTTNYWQRILTTLSPATYGDHITTSGNVGIGSTASPINKLDVYGGVAIGSSYAGFYVAPQSGMIVSGNVGIGTTSPTQKLDIAGNLRVGGSAAITSTVNLAALTSSRPLKLNASKDIVATQIDLASVNDIIGILGVAYGGTNINGSTAPNGSLLIGNGTGYTLANLTAGTAVSIANASGSITLNHSDTSSVTDSSNSDGTVIQSLTFDDLGHTLTRGTINLDSRYIGLTTPLWFLAADSGTPYNISVGNTANILGGNGLSSGLSGNNLTLTIGAGIGISVGTNDVSVNQGYNFAWTGTQSWSNTATFTNNVYLPGGIWNSSGNVGIGTTSPSATYKLDVVGNINVSGTGVFNSLHLDGALLDQNNSPGSANMVLTSVGNGVSWITLSTLPVGNAETVDNYHVSGSTNYIAKYTSATNLGYSTLLYDDGTNIGIGTSSPTSVLTVQGTNSDATVGNELLTVQADRDFSSDSGNWAGTNWGIGSSVATHAAGANNFVHTLTATAGKTYQIKATINTTTVGSLDVKFGGTYSSDVGQSVGTLTQHTWVIVATGTESLRFVPNTTWAGTIDDVTVKEITPSNALVTLNQSDGTAGLEIRSGGLGEENTYIGLYAGESSVTGSYSTALGTSALRSNVSGDENTAVGNAALYSNTSGVYNTAMGYLALYSNAGGGAYTGSSFNNAIGVEALYYNSTGKENTALGVDSLYYNTTGNYNVALGNYALMWNETGSKNVALGTDAALHQETGSNNVFIGYQAGYGSAGYSASGNILLGYQAGYYELGSNKLYIDNSNTRSPLIWGDFATDTLGFNGNVGIGTTNPTQRLDVNGNLNVGNTAIFNTIDLNGTLIDAGNSVGATGFVLSSTGTGVSWGNLVAMLVGQYEVPLTFSNGLTRNINDIHLGGALQETTAIDQDGHDFGLQGGNVGIGTTSPTSGYKLDVQGNVNIGGSAMISDNLAINLGIGDTVGPYKLYVDGDVLITGGTTIVEDLRLNGNQILNSSGTAAIMLSSNPSTTWSTLDAGSWKVQNTANASQAALAVVQDMSGDIFTASSSDTKFVIKNDGSVGIGTTSPGYKLDVVGYAHFSDNTFFESPDDHMHVDIGAPAGKQAALGFSQGGIQKYGIFLPTNNSGDLRFYDQDDYIDVMVLKSGGNVGIGTTNPTTKLFLRGTNPVLTIDTDGTGYNDAWTYYQQNGSLKAAVGYRNNNSGLTFWENGADRMVIRSGNVGIGTTNPQAKLDIGGATSTISNVSGDITLNSASNNISFAGDSLININNIYMAGNLGIGTSSPNYNLQVGEGAAVTSGIPGGEPGVRLHVSSNVAGGAAAISVGVNEGTDKHRATFFQRDNYSGGDWGLWNTYSSGSNRDFVIGIGNTEKLRIETDGSVGIGMTTPGSLLQLGHENSQKDGIIRFATGNGTQRRTWAAGVKYGDTSNTGDYYDFTIEDLNATRGPDLLIQYTNGNVGIGTTNPDQKLDVIGTIQASNLLGVATTLSTDTNGNIIRTPSDLNLKENIAPIENALGKVLALQGVSFDWKDKERFGDQAEIGLIAQDVEKVIPEVVRDGPEYKSINYPNLVAVLIEAIKEQQRQISSLAGKVTEIASSLVADNIMVNQKLTSPVIDTGELTADGAKLTRVNSDYISPLSGNDLVIDLTSPLNNPGDLGNLGTGETGTTSDFGTLLVKGNAEFTGNVSIGQTLEAKDASISGELYAESARIKKLRAESIEGLEAIFATMSANYITNTGKAYNNSNNVSGLEEQISTPSADLDLTDSSLTTDSSQLEEMASSWDITNPSDDVKIESNVSILGVTTLAQTVVSGPFTQDGTLLVDNGNSINVLGGTLYLQNQGGGLDLLAGKVTIDPLGNTVFEGNLTVKATLFAGLVKPLDGGDLTIDLSHSATDSSQPASVGFGRLLARGANGETVFSLDASGSAQFSGEVAATSFKIARDAVAAEPDIYGTIEATASAGLAKIPAGSYEVTIKSPYLNEKSLIYLTPVGSTGNQVIYLARTSPDYQTFTAAIDRALTKDILFSWWIVN